MMPDNVIQPLMGLEGKQADLLKKEVFVEIKKKQMFKNCHIRQLLVAECY